MTSEERISEAKNLNNEVTTKMLNLAKEYGTDLIEVSVHGSPCEECAKYQGRIYSISGNDKRFPKYPDWLLSNACPYNCGLMSYPFIEGISEPTYINGDVIEVSNRPFIDDRTPEQIAVFEARRDKILKERQYRIEYEQLQKLLPNEAECLLTNEKQQFKRIFEAQRKSKRIWIRNMTILTFSLDFRLDKKLKKLVS